MVHNDSQCAIVVFNKLPGFVYGSYLALSIGEIHFTHRRGTITGDENRGVINGAVFQFLSAKPVSFGNAGSSPTK
ncbi:hypothetical protein PCI56_01385 [Plesiomonas shigelloides subsp. oncorhynchi]|nr:hypothetical protein [Plesiomonas shigelloides]